MLVIQATVWPGGRNPDHITRHEGDRYGDLTLVSLIVVNDGTGEAGGYSEGGTGNYDVYEGDPHSRGIGHPKRFWKRLGRIEDVPRTPEHRTELVRRALELAAQ